MLERGIRQRATELCQEIHATGGHGQRIHSLDPPPDPRWTKFLAGLAALSKETGIGIAACGCCRSPWLAEVAAFDGYTVDHNGERLTMVIGGVPAIGKSQHG